MNATSITVIFEYARTAALLAAALFFYADVRCQLLGKGQRLVEAWDIAFFALFTVLAMQVEVVLIGEVPVNFRTVAVAFAALFGGPWAALVASATGLLMRNLMGGTNNTALGTLLILIALVVGLSCRWWIAHRGRTVSYRDLLVVGAVLDVGRVIAWLAILGRAFLVRVIDIAWIDVLLMMPVSVFLLGATTIIAQERRLLARSVADSEARFRNVLDQLPNALTLVDLDDRFTFVNQAQAALIGIPTEEQLGKTRQASWDRAGVGRVPRNYLEQVLATGKTITTKPIRIPRSGNPAWVIGTVFPVHNANGDVKEIGSVGVDVTELWQAREEVARREDMMKRLTQALVEAVRNNKIGSGSLPAAVQQLTEIAGEALEVERTGVFRFDLETEDVERVDLWERSRDNHFPPAVTSKSSAWHETGLMERDEVLVVEDAASDIRTAALSTYMNANNIGAMLAAPIFVNGLFKGIVTFSHVEGPRKWAVEEIGFARSIADIVSLLYLTDRYREALAALDLIEDGIYVAENGGRVIYANRRAMELARGKTVTAEAQLPLRTFPATFPYLQRPLQGDQDRYETSIDLGAGHRDVQIMRHRLPDDGAIVLIRDLTLRNRAQRERQRLESQLLQASKLEAIGQLAGGVAHDFNNLLGAIMGFARFIEEDLPTDSNQHRYARRIIAACERGKSIVTQITSFSRARRVERGVIDLATLIRESRDLLAGLIRPSTFLSVSVSDAALFALGNEGQITQILVNLVANANDALEGRSGTIAIRVSRVGGGEAVIDTEERQLSLFDDKYRRRLILGQLDPEGDYARIDVTDSGKGMSPRIVPRIFDPFYTNKRRTGGTGLGLAVVHSIVSSYEGVLYLDTVEGRGTTFSIYLPLIASADAERETRAAATQNEGTERVLIVDDDVDVADMLSIGLARMGYEVSVSNDPLEALEAFTEEPRGWDVAVVDRIMPDMDGVELAQKLKAIRGDLRIVLCTGLDDGAIELSEGRRGCDLLFVKPVSPEQIADAIRQLFDQ